MHDLIFHRSLDQIIHFVSSELNICDSLTKFGMDVNRHERCLIVFPSLFRGLYLSVILFYKDNLLVTNEDQIPIVEIDDSHSSSVMQDFLWFTKVMGA